MTKTDRIGSNAPFGTTYTIAPTSHRMTGIASLGIGYAIDAAGNRTADSTTTWVVNARGRVSRVRVISGAATYTYNYLINGLHQRVRKTGPSSVVPQGTQVFVYDEAGRLIGEYDNYGRARNEHIWLADRPVALIVTTYSGTSTTPLTTTFYSVEADHLGTPRLITDSTQAPRWSWHSAPYGDTQPNEKPGTAAAVVYNLRFPGQYFDKEVNTFYNWHRDYESTTGRYVQSDPIGLAGGINTYAYAAGNPVRFFDRYGLEVVIGGHIAADPVGTATRPDSIHLSIQLRPDSPADFSNASGWTRMPDGSLVSTLRGQPGGDLAFRNAPWGNLRYTPNYPGDSPDKTPIRVRVSPPCGMTDTQFINALIAAAGSYGSDLRYSPFPKSFLGTYNSNSFVSGVLRAAGAKPPDLELKGRFQAPGYTNRSHL